MRIVLTSYEGIFTTTESATGQNRCQPVEGNLKFFRALYQQLKETRRVKSPLGIVTAMNSNRKGGLREQLNNYDWSAFPEFPTELGKYSLFRRRFTNIECAGDRRGPAYINNSPGGIRSSAYRALCERLSVMPDDTIITRVLTRALYGGGGRLNLEPSQTITFEATAEGVRAANSAGISCVGVRAEGSKQDLSEAAVVVEGTLENILGAVPAIAYSSPTSALDSIAKTRSNIYWTYGEKKLENRLNTQPVKENEPVLLIYDETLILFQMPKERNIEITTEDRGVHELHSHCLCLKVNSPVYLIKLGYHFRERSQKANFGLHSFLLNPHTPLPERCTFRKPPETKSTFLSTDVYTGEGRKYDNFESIIVFGGKAIRSVVEESELFDRYKEYLPLAQPLVEKFLDESPEAKLK